MCDNIEEINIIDNKENKNVEINIIDNKEKMKMIKILI